MPETGFRVVERVGGCSRWVLAGAGGSERMLEGENGVDIGAGGSKRVPGSRKKCK